MKIFFVKANKIGEKFCMLFFAIIIAGAFCITYLNENDAIYTMMPMTKKTIVIDAGHGGWDPGKTGTSGENEKDINLKIAHLLQQYLEQGGATVIITRNDDNALAKGKREDMKNRKAITNESEGDLLISIHQNSFPRPSAKGAQVFYHNGSKESQNLAECIQNAIKENADTNNSRLAKANTDYYILKTTNIPAAIVECGFLSNADEEKKLNDEGYQEKIAWSIYVGIIDYFKQQNDDKV